MEEEKFGSELRKMFYPSSKAYMSLKLWLKLLWNNQIHAYVCALVVSPQVNTPGTFSVSRT